MRFNHIVPRTLALCLMLTVSSLSAWAHKVNIYAYVEGDVVFTESYFPDGKKVIGGKIAVLDKNKQSILEGVTDKNGLYNFKLPETDSINIVLDASMGHSAEFKLKTGGGNGGPDKGHDKKSGVTLIRVFYGLCVIAGTAAPAYFLLKRKESRNLKWGSDDAHAGDR